MEAEEIKKALECCKNGNSNMCQDCPYAKYKGCHNRLMSAALDLIKILEIDKSMLQLALQAERQTPSAVKELNKRVEKHLKAKTAVKDGKIDKHKELCTYLHETYKNKNADYGDSFAEMFAEFGIITAITRIGDKFNRLKNLYKNKEQKVKDESVRDTLLDMANYCLMTVAEIDNSKNKTEVKK